jgi:hypothetical protein
MIRGKKELLLLSTGTEKSTCGRMMFFAVMSFAVCEEEDGVLSSDDDVESWYLLGTGDALTSVTKTAGVCNLWNFPAGSYFEPPSDFYTL